MDELTRRGFLGMAGAAGGALAAAAAAAQDSRGEAPAPAWLGKLRRDLALRTHGLPPFPSRACEERLGRLRAAMEARGTDAVLLGPTLHLPYFTGASWGVSERLFGCAVLREPAFLVWISPKFEEARAREAISGLGDPGVSLVTWEEWEDPHARLLGALAERIRPPEGRNARARLAVDSHLRATHALRLRDAAARRDATPRFEVDDALPLLAEVRARKEPEEIARIRRACEITQRALEWVRAEVLAPGVTEVEAAEAMREAQRQMGLRSPWALVLFGANAAFPHGTKDRRPLEAGQLALLDCGGELDGYQSDVTRTYCIGAAPKERQRSIYALVRDAQEAALAAARPGVPCEAVDRAARAVIERGGFGPQAKYFTHRLGHGIGLEGHEDPYFCEGNATILAPGMTLSDEPGIYVPGEIGVRLEDIVVITPAGAERLGAPPPREP